MNAPQGIELARNSQRVCFAPASRGGSARLIAKCKRGSRALAGGLPTIFQDREDLPPEGFRATGSTHTRPPWQVLHGRTGPRAGRAATLLTRGRYAERERGRYS